jgi:hypothetical protein
MKNSVLRASKMGAVAVLTTLAGCGGSGSSSSGSTTYTIGGTVLGLKSGGSVEVVDGSASLSQTANGAFTFSTGLAANTTYDVTVGTSPAGQSCGVSNGTGVVSANVTNVAVYCTTNVSAATLSGTYEIASFNINSDADLLYVAVPFDGSGTQGASSVLTNQAGTTFATTSDTGASYTVATAAALPSLTVATNNVGAIAGADGDEFYLIENGVNGGNPPALDLGVKPLQTASLSSLAGSWISVGLTQSATPYASAAALTIGSDGSYSGSQTTLDVTGVANTQTVSGAAGSYAVTSNVVSIGGENGYISANGDFLVLTDVVQQAGGAAANYPTLTAAVKQGTGVTLATLSGVYSLGGMSYATASTGDGDSVTVFFDGLGNFSGTVAENDNGTYGSTTWSGTYTVTSSGVLTLTDSNANVFTGGVSADGNVVVAAYLTAALAEPQILVGFKQ